MQIWLNDDPLTLGDDETLPGLLAASTHHTVFAVAINQVFIPKECYEETTLCDGDRIDIVVPMQGG